MRPYFKPILLTTSLFLILLFIVAKSPARAGAAHFPTIEEVQQMIATALSPVQSSMQALSNRVSNLETTVTPIPAQIANLQNRVFTLESVLTTPTPTLLPQKVLKTFDNNDNELGLYVDRQIGSQNQHIDEFFYVPLGKIVVLVDHQIGITRDDVWYQSSDCTGTAYAPMDERSYWSKVNEIVTAGPGKYYTIDRGPGSTVSLNSLQRYDGSAFPCLNATAHDTAWSLTPVTLPFTEPIALPLQYKYQ
jgi:hypothetical protein